MDYIDASYYNSTFMGTAANDDTLDALISRATDIVNMITGQAIVQAGGLSGLSADVAAAVQKATAYQTEYFIQNGGLETANSGQGVASDTVTIGKFSIKQRVACESCDPRVCPMTVSILEQTGLMNRSVQTLGGEFSGFGGWPIW